MTDTPTPPAMTPEQRDELVAWLRRVRMRPTVADQLEADGVTIATITAERDAARADIARLTAALATAREDGMREAMAIAHDHTPEKHSGLPLASHVTGRNIERAIDAAINKGAAT